jgi:hypothetical protein
MDSERRYNNNINTHAEAHKQSRLFVLLKLTPPSCSSPHKLSDKNNFKNLTKTTGQFQLNFLLKIKKNFLI